jgi:hypothetical protein
MRKKRFTFEQWVTAIGFIMLAALVAVFVLYFPTYPDLTDRTEPGPSVADEVYAIALNASGKSYNDLVFNTGRHPFMPATSIQVRSTMSVSRPIVTKTITVVTPTIRPTPTPTPTPTQTVSFAPTPAPFIIPVELVGIVRFEGTDREVLLRVKSNLRTVKAGIGDIIEGMEVIEITAVSVTLRGPNDKLYLLRDPRALDL